MMGKWLQDIPVVVLLLVATILEVCGDSAVRLAVHNHTGLTRMGLLLAGAALLFGYGLFLNVGPIDFGRVVGLYIATLFVVWQVIAFMVFRTAPTLPMLLGGALIVIGGLLVTFWKPS